MSNRIVVGVDGSDRSRRVLAFAYDEARRRGDHLLVVHAYTVPVYWGVPEFGAVVPPQPPEEAVADAEALLDRVLQDAPDDVQVERLVTQGPASAVLLEAAADADLLVVGSRGHGGFVGLLLGSTSHQVVTHCPCPVVVVPVGTEAEDGEGSAQ